MRRGSARKMIGSVDQARRWYAEELRFTARVASDAVVAAFSTVPREQFVGAGPWRIKSPMNMAEYWATPDADPHHVYHDVLIILDETVTIKKGHLSLWALLSDKLGVRANAEVLHLGCG